MTDLLVLVDRYPEANSKQEIQQSTHCPGGQAATAMVTCARLGWKARYVGRFGDDSHGIVGLESLKTEQVDTSATRIVKQTANGFSVIVVDKATGNRTIMWKRSEKLTVRPEDVDAAADNAERGRTEAALAVAKAKLHSIDSPPYTGGH